MTQTLRQKLQGIQLELNVPKEQRNTFGNYNYRSCEDILEALKPLLKKYGCLLIIADNIAQVGDRYYVKAQAMIKDADSSEEIFVEAFAREEETKKGMDGSQITGASSSYARKYALNGLFGIDDTKDSDSTNKHESTAAPTAPKQTVAAKPVTSTTGVCTVCGGPVKEPYKICYTCKMKGSKPIETPTVNIDEIAKGMEEMNNPERMPF